MFLVRRSRRSGLVKRLLRALQPQHDLQGGEGAGQQRALASGLLKRLKEPALEGLVRAVEGGWRDSGACCRMPGELLRLGRRGAVRPEVKAGRLYCT